MKKIFMLFPLMAMMLASCDLLGVLKNYEEHLSLTAEEKDELLNGRYIYDDAGFSLYLDELYDVERIDKDGYPEVDSAIESIVLADGEIVTINFKRDVSLKIMTDATGETRYETVRVYNFKENHLMTFGFDDNGIEEFRIREGAASAVSADIQIYGVEKADETYKVNRIIVRGRDNIAGESYYQFVPEGK